MQPTYTLYYFDIRGRAEQIRLVLTHLNLPFEDKGLDREAWLKLKQQSPLGQMPFLVEHHDGRDVRIPQSMAIMRHLARAYDLYGTTEDERVCVDIAAECTVDLRNAFSALRFSPAWKDEAQKDKYIKETAPAHFARIASLLDKRDYFAGQTPTYADFSAFDALQTHLAHWPGCLDDRPQLLKLIAHIRALPTLQTHFAKQRPA